MQREAMTCPNCGAPADGDRCEYCGSVFKKIKKPEEPVISFRDMSDAQFETVRRVLNPDWIPMIMGNTIKATDRRAFGDNRIANKKGSV